jgi:drug/metabolite transporter (DMT)-like permease
MRDRVLPLLAIAATLLIWGGSYTAIQIGLREIDAIPLAALRFAVAAAPAAVWLAVVRPPLPGPGDLLRFLACGATGIAFYNMLLNTGQQTVSPGAASFIINTTPVFTALLAAILLGERVRVRAWFGMAASLTGIGIIAAAQTQGLRFGAGAGLVLTAALCSATFFVIQRPLVMRHGAGLSTACTLVIGAICLAPWLPQGIAQIEVSSSAARLAVLFLGLLAGSLAYVAWIFSLGHFGAARATSFLYLVSPLAVGTAYLITGEVPDWQTLTGGSLALAGVILVNARGEKSWKWRDA